MLKTILTVLFFGLGLAIGSGSIRPSAIQASSIEWRGICLGGTAATARPGFYYDVFVKTNGGDPLYYTSVPAYNGAPGYLFHCFPRQGNSYSFMVRACDSHGYAGAESEWSEDFLTAFSSSQCREQTVPIADPGPDQVVEIGTQVTLDARGSYDLFSGDIPGLGYRWECYAAPETVVLSDPDSTLPTFTPLSAGSYYFRLYVADYVGGLYFNRSDLRYVRVDAIEDPANAVLANPGPCQSVPLGCTVILDGSRSLPSTGPCRWKHLNGSVPITDANQRVASFQASVPGPCVFELTVFGENDFSSKMTLVSVYDPDLAGSLHVPPVDPDCTDCGGNPDGDADTDGSDLGILAKAFGASRGLPDFQRTCDFDRNNRTDQVDLSILAARFGRTSL